MKKKCCNDITIEDNCCSETSPETMCITSEEIREKAYFIWLETGSTDEESNWLQAIDELSKKK